MSTYPIIFMLMGSVAISLLVLWATWKRIELGRLLLILLFLWASYVNAQTALTNPLDYLNYAQYAWSGWYREFILGYFATQVKLLVLIIAGGQLIIAILLCGRHAWVRVGALGAIIFFIAIMPLGIASGFPTTLILAFAAYLVALHHFPHPVFQVVQNWILSIKRS